MTKAIRVINETGEAHGTKIIDVETGKEIHGATKITIGIDVDDPEIRMKVDLVNIFTHVEGTPTYVMLDPRTGQLKALKLIEFQDGTTCAFD